MSEIPETIVCTQCEGVGYIPSKFEEKKRIRCHRCEGSGKLQLSSEEQQQILKIKNGEQQVSTPYHFVTLLKRAQKCLVKLAGENADEETVALVGEIAQALATDTLIRKGALEAAKSRLSKAGVVGITGLPHPPELAELEELVQPLSMALYGIVRAGSTAGIDSASKALARVIHQGWTALKDAETDF